MKKTNAPLVGEQNHSGVRIHRGGIVTRFSWLAGASLAVGLFPSGTELLRLAACLIPWVLSISAGTHLALSQTLNAVTNGTFEAGTAGWTFYTNGSGTFSAQPAGRDGSMSGTIVITAGGTNVQLFQSGIRLEADTKYRLSFDAYCTTEHAVSVSVVKHTPPYTPFGLSSKMFALGGKWQHFDVLFGTQGFSGVTADARLMFWLTPFAAAGDQYFFDNVALAKDLEPTTIVGRPMELAPVQPLAHKDVPFTHIRIDTIHGISAHCKDLGDINGDGFLDIAVASSMDSTIGVVWYQYPGWKRHAIAPGVFTTEMQLADIDGDGDLDVVIPRGSYNTATVCWYENPRPLLNPTSGPWKIHIIGEGPAHDVAVGDIDNDAHLDVVVRNRFNTLLFLQRNTGQWERRIISTRPQEGLALGDLDGDKDLDVVINGYWLQNPLPSSHPLSGGWTEKAIDPSWSTQSKTLVVDLNKDGRLDVVLSTSETADARLSWFETASPVTGPWIEHPIDSHTSYVHSLRAGDINLDGDLDLVTAEMHQSSDPDEVSVYHNLGNGTRWYHQVVATTGSHNMAIGDLGSDGDIDLLGSNWDDVPPYGAPIEIWENTLRVSAAPLDSWKRHVIDGSRPWRAMFITSADMDRDGRKDIVTGAWWYKNPGELGKPWVRNTIGSPLNNMAAVFDFNKDGLPDVLGTKGKDAEWNAEFVWGKNNGRGSFTILSNVQKGEGDFLQGVAVDRFLKGANSGVALSWHEAGRGVQMLDVPSKPESQTWTWKRISSVSQDEQLSSADLDRDGDTDLVLGTSWLRNDGEVWTPLSLAATTEPPDRNRVADINRDGRLDVVVGFEAMTGPGKLAWYEQPPDIRGLWPEHIVTVLPAGPMSLDVADFDRDGDLDLVVGEHHNPAQGGERLLIFENLGGDGVRWVQHVVYTGDEHHDGAQSVDIDGDGDLDIISIGWTNSLVVLYENRGNRTH